MRTRWPIRAGVAKAVIARELGVSRETRYQALRAGSGTAGAGRSPGVIDPPVEVSV